MEWLQNSQPEKNKAVVTNSKEVWGDFYFDSTVVASTFPVSVAISALGWFTTEKVANAYK